MATADAWNLTAIDPGTGLSASGGVQFVILEGSPQGGNLFHLLMIFLLWQDNGLPKEEVTGFLYNYLGIVTK